MKSPEIPSINIKAVGDICPGDDSIMGLGVYSKAQKYGIDFPFTYVMDVLSNSDLVIGNLEGVLASKKLVVNPSKLRFCGEPAFSSTLARSGFKVLNIANNHTFEYGSAIFSDTIEILENAGIQVCGRRNSTIDYYSMPVFLNIKGLEIGILGYNWVGKDKFNEADTYIAQSHDSIVNYTWNRDGVKDMELQAVVHEKNQNVIHDLRKLKQTVDFVILMTHWGFEFVHCPPLGVKLEARSFIDAGADLIIGTHPHVMQGMERYNNRSVFYSLGNFIFDSRDSKTRYTTILDMQIHDDEKIEYAFKPYYINKEFQPQYANKRQQKKLNEIIDRSTHVINSSSCTIKLNDDDIYRQYERYYNRGKISAIYHLIHAIREDRKVIAVIFRKLQNLFEVIKLQFQGRKVRW